METAVTFSFLTDSSLLCPHIQRQNLYVL